MRLFAAKFACAVLIGEVWCGRCGAGAAIRVVAALEDSPLLAEPSAAPCGRCRFANRGRFNLRSVGGGVASRGECDRDFRFLPRLRGRSSSSVLPSSSRLALSNALHARMSS